MNDMSSVIVPKSDQINADSLIAGPMTVTIREVLIRGGQEQPVSILLEGTDLAFRPCKSMSRVLVQAWGPDARAYVGRSLTLYRDPSVKWGGLEVGGIRISHMSDIDSKMVLQLTATKGQRKPHVVMPLVDAPSKQTGANTEDPAQKWANAYLSKVSAAATADELNDFANAKAKKLEELRTARADLHGQCIAALDAKRASFTSGFEDEDEGEGPADSQRGEQFTDDADPMVPSEAQILRDLIAEAASADEINEAEVRFRQTMPRLKPDIITELRKAIEGKREGLGG